MSTATEPPKPKTAEELKSERVPIDPFVARIAKSVDLVVEPQETQAEVDAAAEEAKKLVPIIPRAEMTVGERMLEETNRLKAETEQAERDKELEQDDTEQAKTETVKVVVAPVVVPASVRTKKSTADQLQEKMEADRAEEARRQEEAARLKKEADDKAALDLESKKLNYQDADAEWEKLLTQDQRDILEVARYAESKFTDHKGRVENTKSFFKKLDTFLESNKDLSPDSQEFREFVESNRPAFPERSKIERQMITDQAVEEASKRVEKQSDEKTRKMQGEIDEIRKRPIVDRRLEELPETMSEAKLPDGVIGVPKEIIQEISTLDPEAAAEKYPVEAPIMSFTNQAVREFSEVTLGLKPMNPNDSTHKWLINFIANQGEAVSGGPAEFRERTQNGRKQTFVPRHVFNSMTPDQKSKHYTFSDDDIVEMIGINAHLAVHNETKRLEKGGFKRSPPPAAATNGVHKEEKEGAKPSPKARNAPIPGSAVNGKNMEHSAFLDSRYPGASQIISNRT